MSTANIAIETEDGTQYVPLTLEIADESQLDIIVGLMSDEERDMWFRALTKRMKPTQARTQQELINLFSK